MYNISKFRNYFKIFRSEKCLVTFFNKVNRVKVDTKNFNYEQITTSFDHHKNILCIHLQAHMVCTTETHNQKQHQSKTGDTKKVFLAGNPTTLILYEL